MGRLEVLVWRICGRTKHVGERGVTCLYGPIRIPLGVVARVSHPLVQALGTLISLTLASQ